MTGNVIYMEDKYFLIYYLQAIPQKTNEIEKPTKDDQFVSVRKVVTKVTHSTPRSSTSKSFKAVKQESIDSLPDLHGIDPFDRVKTPDPQEPGTLVFALKEGESSSESYNPIEKYYASKNEIHSNEENQENSSTRFNSTQKCNAGTNQEMDTKKSNDEKRNAVLFPSMTQKEIDSLILEVCEKR